MRTVLQSKSTLSFHQLDHFNQSKTPDAYLVGYGITFILLRVQSPERPAPIVSVDLLRFSIAGSEVGKPISADSPFAVNWQPTRSMLLKGKGWS